MQSAADDSGPPCRTELAKGGFGLVVFRSDRSSTLGEPPREKTQKEKKKQPSANRDRKNSYHCENPTQSFMPHLGLDQNLGV